MRTHFGIVFVKVKLHICSVCRVLVCACAKHIEEANNEKEGKKEKKK